MTAGDQEPGQWRRPLRYPASASPAAQAPRSARSEPAHSTSSPGTTSRTSPPSHSGSARRTSTGGRHPARHATRSHARRNAPQRSKQGGRGSFLRELPVLVLVAFVLALLIKAFLVQAFWIPSQSMEQTLLIDDRVLVNKVVYQFRDVHRGEVVVFNGEGTGFESNINVVEEPGNIVSRAVRGAQHLLGLGAPSEKDFIKRVIGVGGDVVACCDAQGRVTVNGYPLDEPYVYPAGVPQQPFEPVTVPDGMLWVMGDHRGDSSDSRNHGPIPEGKVVGKAFVKVWPLSRVGLLRMPETFADVPGPTNASAVPGAPAVLAGVGLVVVPAAVVRRRRVVAARSARRTRR